VTLKGQTRDPNPLRAQYLDRDSVPKDHAPVENEIWSIKWSRDPQRCCEAVRSANLATAWLLVVLAAVQFSLYETVLALCFIGMGISKNCSRVYKNTPFFSQ